jgi:hypothetical protein
MEKRLIKTIYKSLISYYYSIAKVLTILITFFGIASIKIIDTNNSDIFQVINSFIILIYLLLIIILGLLLFKRMFINIKTKHEISIDMKISKYFEKILFIIFTLFILTALLSSNLHITVQAYICYLYILCRVIIIVFHKKR